MARNVGTANYPVSALHERAVALLYDELTRPDLDEGEEIRARLTPGGNLSHDLRAGVAKVKVPDPGWNVWGASYLTSSFTVVTIPSPYELSKWLLQVLPVMRSKRSYES